MTTIVNPASSPTPVYNGSGTTLATIAAAGAFDSTTATQIVAYSGWTIAVVTGASSAGPGVILPVSPNIGDVCEIYGPDTTDSGAEIVVWVAYGDVDALASINRAKVGLLFRYTGSTYGWCFIGYPA